MNSNPILVYSGEGSSHSWTWLADLFESAGAYDAEFLDTPALLDSMGTESSTIVVSGGDGFAIARAISASGFSRIEAHLRRGGQYIGICAGAYLPLPSSIEPLNSFNISRTKIENLDLRKSQSPSPRVSISYGTCSIIHPVRGEVQLKSGRNTLVAPLFGGPIFTEPSSEQVILRYSGFTQKTEFQVDLAIAKGMVLGKPAAISLPCDSGRLLLLGPHLEHPTYPEANKLFLRISGIGGIAVNHRVSEPISSDPDLQRAIADLKVAILGLENRSFLVGNKLWDGSRYMDLLNAVERRSDIDHSSLSSEVIGLLNSMRSRIIELPGDSTGYEDSAPAQLIEAARLCVNHRFERLRRERKQMGL